MEATTVDAFTRYHINESDHLQQPYAANPISFFTSFLHCDNFLSQNSNTLFPQIDSLPSVSPSHHLRLQILSLFFSLHTSPTPNSPNRLASLESQSISPEEHPDPQPITPTRQTLPTRSPLPNLLNQTLHDQPARRNPQHAASETSTKHTRRVLISHRLSEGISDGWQDSGGGMEKAI